MESSEHSAEKQSKIRKKLIPWHCQQRYQTSISQISLNHTLTTASNNRKIKSLLNNNKCLAKALERCRYELSHKENSMLNSAKNVDVINFSRIQLKEVSNNLKNITACVDETVTLLQSHIGTNPPKNLQCTSATRSVFKKRLRAVSNFESLEEVAENLENETNFSNEKTLKGNKIPVLSIKHTIKNKAKKKVKQTPPVTLINKKDKLTVQKSKKQCLKAQNAISSQKITVRTSKPCSDDTPPSYLLGISSDSESFRNLIEQSKKASNCKASKKNAKPRKLQEQNPGLGLQPTSAIPQSEDQQNELDKGSKLIQSSRKKPEKVTGDKALSSTKVDKCAPRKKAKMTPNQFGSEKSQNSSKDILSPIDEKSVESIEKSASSYLETNLKTSAMTSVTNSLPNVPYTETLETTMSRICTGSQANSTVRVLLERKDFMESDAFLKKQTVSLSEIFDESKELPKTALQLKSSIKKKNSCHKKVGFLLDEDDEIEMLSEIQQVVAKPKIKKTQKRPLKESTQNVPFIPSKKQARSTSVSEALELKDKNTFIVTAEVHQPPDGYTPKKRPSIDNVHLLNMQPTVVLTDIFRSNSQKKRFLEKVYQLANQVVEEDLTSQIVEKELSEVQNSETTSSDNDFDAKCNKENKIDAQIFSEDRKQSRRRSKVSSYKEMKLNVKMRRC